MKLLIVWIGLTSLVHLSTSFESCGLSNGDEVILNGCQEATIEQFPWHVGIFVGGMYYCGGSIISERHILTTAMCGGPEYGAWDVIIGGTTSDYIIHSTKSIAHPKWDGGYTLSNNIAIIELDEPIEFGDTAKPICLVNSADYSKDNVIAGNLGANGVIYRSETILDRKDCENYWGPLGEDLICLTAQWINWPCCGSSGNILALSDQDIFKQVGLHTVGDNGCKDQPVTVYTDVFYHLDWISEVTGLKFK